MRRNFLLFYLSTKRKIYFLEKTKMESDNIESVVPDTNNLSHLMIKKELCNESENVILDEVNM